MSTPEELLLAHRVAESLVLVFNVDKGHQSVRAPTPYVRSGDLQFYVY